MTDQLYKSIFDIENKSDEYEDLDLKIIQFIKMANNKSSEKIPEPKYFTISTQSAMCRFSNVIGLDLSKVISYISEKIIRNVVLGGDTKYMIKGIVIDNIIIRYDDTYLRRYKRPYIRYMGNIIDINSYEDIVKILDNLMVVENESLKKQGKQTKKKENEHFYNSCSIIVKAGKNDKCVNIKLFNNGKITMTGAKKESDGYNAAVTLLTELKKEPGCFLDSSSLHFDDINIFDYQITMINSDFDTNFKIDLITFLNILNNKEKNLFTKFNPEKYRGLIIGYYWNNIKPVQDGICHCKGKCTGKGLGDGEGRCKKITISIFKSGSIIITGGRLIKQIEDAYYFINEKLRENYSDIVKLSILDYIQQEEEEEHEDVPLKKKIIVKKCNIKK